VKQLIGKTFKVIKTLSTVTSFIIILAFFQVCSFAQEHDQVTGIVFHDLNNNGKLDENEPGIAGVPVSNQQDVVLTDAKGNYALPVEKNGLVFISKPSGFNVALNENNLPQFYYLHSPEGSPEGLDFRGVSASGALPESLNFALTETEPDSEFTVIVSGDPQPYTSEQVNYYLNDVVSEMLVYNSDLYLALGDLVEDDLDLYDQLNEGVRHLNIPAYNVIGNHDMNLKAKNNRFKAETFRRVFGPDYYSFNRGKVHFMVLNSIQYEGWNKEEGTQGRYFGGFEDRQLEWMANDLKFVPDDYLLVIVTHIPILEGPMKKETMDQVFDLLKNRKHLLALAGHQHKIDNGNYSSEEYWTQPVHFPYLVAGAACGSWWSKVKDERGIPLAVAQDGTPNGFFVFNFKDYSYSFKFHPANHNPGFQMRISAPRGKISLDSLGNEQIIVNVFAAHPDDPVKYQVDDGPPQRMTNQIMIDPLVADFFNAYTEIDEWVKPRESSHIWTAILPADLEPGSHLMKITTTDRFNNEYEAYQIFEIK
jgi:hypothetical protein